MDIQLFIIIVWAVLSSLLLAGLFTSAAARDRHYKRLKKEADDAAERHARNSVFPTGGKTVRILR